MLLYGFNAEFCCMIRKGGFVCHYLDYIQFLEARFKIQTRTSVTKMHHLESSLALEK